MAVVSIDQGLDKPKKEIINCDKMSSSDCNKCEKLEICVKKLSEALRENRITSKLTKEENRIFKLELKTKLEMQKIMNTTDSDNVYYHAKKRIEVADLFFKYLFLKYPDGYKN